MYCKGLFIDYILSTLRNDKSGSMKIYKIVEFDNCSLFKRYDLRFKMLLSYQNVRYSSMNLWA